MKKPLKWVLTAGALLLFLAVGAGVLIPRFVEVHTYKPRIEQLVSARTGRAFAMGDDIKLSLFPWVGVSLTDLSLGNPQGFEAREMVVIKRFEVRLKVIPLISRRIEVDHFVVDTPQLFLERTREGQGNWENLGPDQQVNDTETTSQEPGPGKQDPGNQDPANQEKAPGLPIESLAVENFSILNGRITYGDPRSGLKKEITELNLTLTDISFDRPLNINLAAKIDGRPLALEGQAGPLGKDPGQQDIDLDLNFKALDLLNLTLKGRIMEALADWKIDMDLAMDPFSPRKLFSALGRSFPVSTFDPLVLDKAALKAHIAGSATRVSLSQATLVLDDTTLNFMAEARAFDPLDLHFDLTLDTLDLDRYLPAAQAETDRDPSDQATVSTDSGQREKTGYAPLRTLVLDGRIRAGRLKVAHIQIQDMIAHVKGTNGVFDLDPLTFNLYQGNVASKARLDLRKGEPATHVTLEAAGIQAGPLLKDALEKEIIEGTLAAALTLDLTGDHLDPMKKSLGGKGNLNFTDGAVVGIDIANMVRNVTSGLGLGEKPGEKPRTDFAQLIIPFSAARGVVTIPGASLMSPLLRLEADGNADLVREILDFRVMPRVVATLKGQGDTQERSGLMVPLLVTGSFASPRIQPDLKAMIQGGVPNADNIKQLLETKDLSKERSVEETAKELLKGFMPRLNN